MLCPCHAEPLAPAGMYCREHDLTEAIMEQGTQEFEFLVWVAKSVAMGEEEHLAVDLGGERLFVEYHTALLLKVVVGPDIVVAGELVYLDTQVCEF